MLIDSHTHLNFNAYQDDFYKVIQRSLDSNIWMINIGSQLETSKRAIEIAEKYQKGVYAAIGLHPINLKTGLLKVKKDFEETENESQEEYFDYKKYKDLAKSEKVVAVGEFGLDYYWKPKTTKKKQLFKEKQKKLFLEQLKFAKELNLPAIFHSRLAHNDLIEVLAQDQKFKFGQPKGVIHGFVGTNDQLKEYLEFGFYIGFNGIIFKKIEGINFEENIKEVPLDKILVETDCPYLTPPPLKGRNEPVFLKYIVEKIAKIKSVSFEEIAQASTQNAKNLFGLKE